MFKKLRIVFALASLSISMCLMSNTYSRYVAGSTGSLDMQLAKWQILVNSSDITNNANASLSLTPIITNSQNVAGDYIAPSSTGYFDITIDPSNVNVSFTYTMNFQVSNASLTDILVTDYAFVPANYIEGQQLQKNSITNNTITNSLYINDANNNGSFSAFKIRFYFQWQEGTGETMNDAADTAIASNPQNDTFSIDTNINFSQII